MRSFRKTFLFGTVLAACAYAPVAWPDTLAVVCKSDFNLALLDPAAGKVPAKRQPAAGRMKWRFRRMAARPTFPISSVIAWIVEAP